MFQVVVNLHFTTCELGFVNMSEYLAGYGSKSVIRSLNKG